MRRAMRDLDKVTKNVNWSDPLEARDELVETIPELVSQWSGVMAEQALVYAESMLNAPLALSLDIPWEKIIASIRWAIAPVFGGEPDVESARENLRGSVGRHMRQPARDQLIKAGSDPKSHYGWARVLRGEYDCAFCIVLASRGSSKNEATGLYTSKTSAGYDVREVGGDRFHDFCDCEIIMVKSDEDYPEGYSPDKYYDMYKKVWSSGDSIKDVTTKMRETYKLAH